MRDTLRRLVRMIAGYGAIQWAGPFLSFIFTPVITRVLAPGDYGVADYLTTVVSALSTVALLAQPWSVTTHFNDRPGDQRWQRTLTGSALAIATTSGAICGALLFWLAPVLTARIPILGPYTGLVRLAAATFVFGIMGAVLTTASQAALRVRWGMVFSLITILGTVFGNVVFVVVLRLGVTGMILTPVVTGIGVWGAGLILGRELIGRPSRETLRLLLRSGAILLPTMLAGWVLQVSDRLFLGQYVTEAELGYYAIANRMAALVGVAMGPVYSAWTPLALALQHQAGATERYVAMARYLIAAVLAAGLGIGLFATEILIVLTRPAYLPAAPYVGFLTYVQVIAGFGAIITTGALMGKQLASVSGTVVAGALLNLALNAALIPRFGIWGAVAATIAGYGVHQILLYVLLRRSYPLPYPMTRFFGAVAVQFGLMLAGLAVPAIPFAVRVTIKLAIFALLPAALLGLRMMTPWELRQAGLFVRHRAQLILGRGQAQ